MILFRTIGGNVLVRKPNDQFFTDDNRDSTGEKFYVNLEGWPVNADGIELVGGFVTTFSYTADEFIKAFPQAEEYRRFLTERHAKLAIVQSLPPWAWFVGSFYIVTCYPAYTNTKHPQYSRKPCVIVNDGDDSYMRKYFETDAEAEAAFSELLALAPFIMPDLDAWGYEAG
jgi:hypothetical protein